MNGVYFKVISDVKQLQIINVLQSQLDTIEYFKNFVALANSSKMLK